LYENPSFGSQVVPCIQADGRSKQALCRLVNIPTNTSPAVFLSVKILPYYRTLSDMSNLYMLQMRHPGQKLFL
jgi:hypothetical protein